MMTVSDLEHFKNLLLEREHNLSVWLDSGAPSREEDTGKVQSLLAEIKDALGRVEDHTFGECRVCQGEIEHYRLEIQPATEVCIDCISKEDKRILEEELFLASKFHRALLPQKIVKIRGFDVAVKSFAARTIGGDYYDFLPGKNDSVRVVIADIMGKGLPAGLLMSNVQGALRILAGDVESPSKLLSRLNGILCRNLPVTKFVSMVCVAIEPHSGDRTRITYANGGHFPPILARSDGRIDLLETNGGVLGVHEDFFYEESSVELATGDLLLFYTDGVTEAENDNGEMFGEERLMEFVAGHKQTGLNSFLDHLLKTVHQFVGRIDLDDDCTVIALQKL